MAKANTGLGGYLSIYIPAADAKKWIQHHEPSHKPRTPKIVEIQPKLQTYLLLRAGCHP
jgi:hypothetical protein